MQNRSGNFVEASAETVSAAADMELPDDMRATITDSPSPDSYPVSCFTWILVYRNQAYGDRNVTRGRALVDLLHYVLSEEAQSIAANVHYAPLPEKALEKAKRLVDTIVF
jgi:phosphate transport system substrate-binding protein